MTVTLPAVTATPVKFSPFCTKVQTTYCVPRAEATAVGVLRAQAVLAEGGWDATAGSVTASPT